MFDFFRKKRKKETKSASYDDFAMSYGLAQSHAGIYVTPSTALQCSTVLACVRTIANGIAQVPFRLVQQKGEVRKPAMAHPLYDLLYMAPNEWQDAFEFWHMVMMHLTLTGNAYIWINRLPDGRIAELLPYPPGSVSIQRDGWKVQYSITLQDKTYITVPQADMWHIRWLAWDGVCGLNAVAMAREAVGLALSLDAHGATSFKNGSRLSGFLSVAQRLDEQQRKSLRHAWEEAFGGAENSGKIAVLGADMKYQQLQATNDVSQYDQTRRYQVEEICRAFGVDPVMIGYSDKAATFASVEQKSIQHIVYCLGPWYSCIEKSADRWLLTAKERRIGYYFKFNVNALLRGASADRASFYTQLYNIGAISPNEIRELEDMNPYEGGDEYRVPLNMEEPGKNTEEGDEDASQDQDRM